MPRYKFAFPINNAVFAEEDLSFQFEDVSFVKKSNLSKESFFLQRRQAAIRRESYICCRYSVWK